MPSSTTPGLAWASPFSLEGGITADPAVAANADDRLSVFVRGGGSDLYVRSQKRDWTWGSWTPIAGSAGTVASSPVAVRAPDGIISVFWRGSDNSIRVARQAGLNTDSYALTQIASGAASAPAVALNADGRISVFYNGTDRALWHVYQTSVAYPSGWKQPESLAGDTAANNTLTPAAVRGGDGLIQVFVTGAANEIWGISQKAPDSTSSWSSYFIVSARNAGVVGHPTAVTDADGRIRVFWRAGNVGYHAVQPAGYGTTYQAPGTTQGKIVETPVAILAMDGRLEVFVVADTRALYVCEQKQVNGNDFADAAHLGGKLTGLPVPARYHDNRIVVAYHGSDNAAWAIHQVFA
ncbi:hypothetical protein AB0I84_47635 [Streptomyces spectabilis]|uniref:hypothetical protein n=1 Tax=Streptomyces spectabilis TaxID=68270 RepID=UPI0033C932A1